MPVVCFLPVHFLFSRFMPQAATPNDRMTHAPRRHATLAARFAIPLRFALRDLRGGLRGFYVFIACIALGVMAIAGVNSFASSLGDGLAREGRTILGGDLAFTLIHREADATERAFLDRAGRVSAAATMRAMAQRVEDARSAWRVEAH